MKIPTLAKVLKTPILTFCLFVFTSLLFLLITPNLSKPAYAASCNNNSPSVVQGSTINVSYDGIDLSVVNASIVLNPGAIVLGPVTKNSATGPQNENFTVPTSVASGSYTVAAVIAPITGGNGAFFANCGNLQVTPRVATLCSYSFLATVPPGGSVPVTINGFSGNTFEAGITGVSTPITQTQTGATPLTITLSAPTQPGNYVVYATDVTNGGNAGCVYAPPTTSSALTVIGTNPTPKPTPTPQPTPPTGPCSVTSTNGWTLNTPTVSGNNVAFNFSPASNGNIGLIVDKDSSFSSFPRPFDSGTITNGQPSISWNGAPPGTYCAVLVFATTYVSNAVSFTVGQNTGDTCSSSALMWVNDVRCRAIGGGWFDSDVFTLGQSAMTLESFNIIITGDSTQIPQVGQVTARKGALALAGNMVASLYSAPPASGVQYFAQKIHDLNPVTPAYAAAGGIGYQTLGPVQKIWIAFRNIAYVGFIIVFVIMGFMIMFRAHISPQAVATVQDSIPRLVIALILVTFSYAIAGFMIDIMFLILNIAIQALVSTKLISGADFVFKDNVFTVIWGNWKAIFTTVASAIHGIITQALDLPGWLKGLFGWAGGTLAGLVIGIALLFIMFRIFLMLLMAYVMIILLTMFAPFFFLIQALPGNNGAKEWFRQMASNIAVFPTVALMFIFAGIMGGLTKLGAASGSSIIQPGQIGQFPLIIGNLNPDDIGKLIGIGFLLVTPSAADIVKNAFGGKSGGGGGMGNLGAAALAGAGAGMAVVGAAGRGAWEQGYKRSPFGQWAREGEQMRQERASVQAREKIFQKIKGTPEAEKYEKRGIGYNK